MASISETPKDCEVADGESWQFNKSVTECNRHMLEHRIATDVTFLVSCDSDKKNGNERCQLSAHKYVLISRSPVFYSMLCGDLAERGEITVTDVDPEAFRQLLNFIYTDDLDLKPDLVMFILYAAKKYMLPGLTKKCTDYLQDQLDASNACIILDQSILFDEKELAERCMQLIRRHTKAGFHSESFTGVRQTTLGRILDSQKLTIKEVDVFKACLKWADKKCQEQKLETTGENRRKVLGDCFTKLRYADIDIGEFATVVSPSGILTYKEEVEMYRHLANKKSNPLPAGFCSDSRLLPGPYEIMATETMQQAQFSALNFDITVVCNSEIKLNTFVIGTSSEIYPGYITALSSVTHNGVNVPGGVTKQLDAQKQEWKCNRQLLIKAGKSNLRMNYTNNWGNAYDSNVHILPKTEINLKDDHIKMQLKSNYQWMPILGLTYELA